MKNFSVTYERWTEQDTEIGDTDDRDFIIEDVSLRDAIQLGLEYRDHSWAGACEVEHRWITFYDWNEGTRDYYETGTIEQRSLHIPDNITPSSRQRIHRLFK